MSMLDKGKVFMYDWVVEHFSMLPHQEGDALTSPIFVVENFRELHARLVLYPKGRRTENEGFISVYLLGFKEVGRDKDLKFAFSVTLVSTEPSSSITWSRKNFRYLESSDFPYFGKLRDIFESKHLFLPQDTLTLRFKFLPIEEASREGIVNDLLYSAPDSSLVRCSALSGTLAHRRSITLQVRNINELRDRLAKVSFVLETAFQRIPALNISLHFTDFLSIDYVRIEIRQMNLPFVQERYFVKCKMTVISAHKKYQESNESTYLLQSSPDNIWHFPPFIKTSNLTRDKYLYFDDTLLLQCEFAFSCMSSVYHLDTTYTPPTYETEGASSRTVSELVTNLEELYVSEKLCDVTLRAGDQTFPAHKVVLSAMSPRFNAMFRNDSKERDSSVVEIEDVDPDTLRRMLAFIHSDDLKEDLSLESTCLLFSAADKYDLDTLRRRCSVMLVSSLSVANVCDILVLAEAHQDNFLLTAVRNFICSHTNEIFYSEHWKSFMNLNPKLSGEIMYQMWIKKGLF